MTANKQFILRLSKVTQEIDAGPTAMFLALTKCVFIEENPSHERLAQICNITNRTLTRNAKKMSEIVSKVIQVKPSQYVYVADKMSTPIDNLSTTTDKMSTSPDKMSIDTSKEKGKEEERKFSPQTPFIKKEGEKGKENTHTHSPSIPQGGNVTECEAHTPSSSKTSPYVTQGASGHSSVAYAANTTSDQVTSNVPLQYEDEFTTFVQAYPSKRQPRGSAVMKFRVQWKEYEANGWTGEMMLAALRRAIASEEWTNSNQRFVPNAIRFLKDELIYGYLPEQMRSQIAPLSQDAVAFLQRKPVATDSITLANPAAFAEFCELYPKKRGLLTPEERIVAEKAWKGCEERGWHAYDIIRALKDALVSQSWTEKDGRYIPSAEKFLNEEQMRQFLPIGFKTNGGSTLAKQPISAEKAFFLNPENFI